MRLSKKVVFQIVKIWRVCPAEVSKIWPFGGPEAAILLPLRTDDTDLILHGKIAVLGLANGHLCETSVRQIHRFFANRTTIFLTNVPNFSP